MPDKQLCESRLSFINQYVTKGNDVTQSLNTTADGSCNMGDMNTYHCLEILVNKSYCRVYSIIQLQVGYLEYPGISTIGSLPLD